VTAAAIGADAGPARRPSLTRRALRAFGAGFVPSTVAAHAGGLAWSAVGLPDRGALVASLVFAGVWAVVFFVRRTVRRTRSGRVAWGLALATWAVVATTSSLLAWPGRAAGPVSAPSVTRWPATRQAFLAGVGEASFHLTTSDTIAGYGMRPRRIAFPWPAPGPLALASLALMARPGADGLPSVPQFERGTPGTEDLGAKAVVIRPAGTGAPLAICRLDLIMCDGHVPEAVLTRVRDLGFTRDTLVVCATHTHSGPGGVAHGCVAQAIATDHFRPEVLERVVAAATSAIRAAYDAAVPAKIGFVRAKDEGPDGRPLLAANRSADDREFVDREILGIRLDATGDGRRIALVLNAAVHPVWGRPKDMTFSSDITGVLERTAAIADGARVVYVNGAVGDVRPKLRHATVAAFAEIVGPSLRGRATSSTLSLAAATVSRDLGAPRYVHQILGDREHVNEAAAEGPFGGGLAGFAGGCLALPGTAILATIGYPDVKLAVSVRGGFGAVIALERAFEHTVFPFGALRLETEDGVALIAVVPLELNTSVGLEVKAAGRRRGGSPVAIFGLANDYGAYVASRAECAVDSYESRMTLFGPGTAEAARGAIDAAFDAVGSVGSEPAR